MGTVEVVLGGLAFWLVVTGVDGRTHIVL